jgi:hypothetical protein
VSFLADPPALFGAGALAGATLDEDQVVPATAVATGVFLGVSIPLYMNVGWIEWFARMWGAESGRDFMLNSGRLGLGLLSFDPAKSSKRRHIFAILLFLAYPLFFRLGWAFGRRLRLRSVRGGADTDPQGQADQAAGQEATSGPSTRTPTRVK